MSARLRLRLLCASCVPAVVGLRKQPEALGVGRRRDMMKAVRDEGVGERRVLVVDDEYSIVDAVATALRYEGFDGHDGGIGAYRVGRGAGGCFRPDRPRRDAAGRRRFRGGPTGPRRWRSIPRSCSSRRETALDDKAAGFGAGADDYVTKPFSLAEIVMRVQAILRRSVGGPTPPAASTCCASPTS